MRRARSDCAHFHFQLLYWYPGAAIKLPVVGVVQTESLLTYTFFQALECRCSAAFPDTLCGDAPGEGTNGDQPNIVRSNEVERADRPAFQILQGLCVCLVCDIWCWETTTGP